MKSKKGIAILTMMIIIWAATLVGYGIHRVVSHAPTPVDNAVDK